MVYKVLFRKRCKTHAMAHISSAFLSPRLPLRNLRSPFAGRRFELDLEEKNPTLLCSSAHYTIAMCAESDRKFVLLNGSFSHIPLYLEGVCVFRYELAHWSNFRCKYQSSRS